MLIDFEKAFDSLEWDYTREVLTKYNFGDQFRKWYNILYQGSQSCVINGGHFSSFFELGRGCRQGDPLSSYLFILAVEPLARAIKNNKKIRGIDVKGIKHVIGQFADDTFLLMDGSEGSLREALEVLDNFHMCSGLNTNVDKTKLAWLGSNTFSLERLCPHVKLKWVTEFKLLGIMFSVNLDNIAQLNYQSK